MPSTMVPKTPMGSRPGRRRRAIAPAMRPMMIKTMMKVTMLVELPRSRVLCVLVPES